MAVFTNADNQVVPDSAVYQDWWAKTDERRKRLAVGTRKYSTVKKQLGGEHPEWEHFLDPKTGELLSTKHLETETPAKRQDRLAEVQALLARRRELLNQVRTYQFELPAKKAPKVKPVPTVHKSKGSNLEIHLAQPVRPEHLELIHEALSTVPRKIRDEAHEQGVKIVTGKLATEIMPELAKQTPRGWPAGSSWDQCGGFYNPALKKVVVTDFTKQGDKLYTEGPWRKKGALRHEFGHGVDHAWGYFSETPTFRAAYEKDAVGHRQYANVLYAYELQAGNAGPEETFAETFAMLHGGGAGSQSVEDTKKYLKDWPNVAKIIRERANRKAVKGESVRAGLSGQVIPTQ